MEYLKDITWDEIFEAWKKREASSPGWIKIATEVKGWDSWEEWRKFTADQMRAEKKKWKLYTVTDPINEIPNMIVGPFNGWQSRVEEKNKLTFKEFLSVPEIFDFYNENQDLKKMIDAFPFETQMIGLIKEETAKIICMEGHHRATAITLAQIANKKIDFQKGITIALAELPKKEADLMDKMLERGTHKI